VYVIYSGENFIKGAPISLCIYTYGSVPLIQSIEFCKEGPPVHEGQPPQWVRARARARAGVRAGERARARVCFGLFVACVFRIICCTTFGPCLGHVRAMFWPCLGYVWTMFGSCLDHVRGMFGPCLGHVWVVFGFCLGHVWAMLF
jgi:hypothetical protein